MKITETLSTKKAHNRHFAATVIAAWTIVCLFVGAVSFSMLSGAAFVYADSEEASKANTESSADYSDSAYISDDILEWKIASCEADSLQSLVDGYFCENALNGNVQSYVQGIITNPNHSCDWTQYATALSEALESAVNSEKGIFPTSLQKSVITLILCHSQLDASPCSLNDILSDSVADEVMSNTIGAKGIMSYIYGLNLLETCNTYSVTYNCEFSREDIINTLIALQCSDGGYSLTGDEGDVDVTAMTLRSLSSYYNASSDYSFSDSEASEIMASIESAIEFLRKSQLSTGDFASYGNACSESTAQVILAANALLLDYSLFTQNDNSLLDGLLIYQMPDRSFSHTASPLMTNDMASAQAYEALSSICSRFNYTCLEEGDKSDDATTSDLSNSDLSSDLDSVNADSAITPAKSSPLGLKTIIYIIIAALFAVACVIFTVLFIRIKNRKRYLMQLVSALLVAGIAAFAVYSINISSREEYLSADSTIIADGPGEGIICISYSISCSTIEAAGDIYSTNTLYVAEGSTAFDVLTEVCRLNDIQLDYESNSVYGTAYVKGIASHYEFDHGDLSGWMYRVNGEFPSVGCGYYALSDGDCVEWLYTTDLGRDLEND